MRVIDCMTTDLVTCHPEDSDAHAAQLMWESDCGVLPVLDDLGRVVGMVTDRDICMGAYTKGERFSALRVRDAMSTDGHHCGPADALEDALGVLARHQVRRVPVLDEDGRLVGLLSMNDVARSLDFAERDERDFLNSAVVETLAAISAPRGVRGPRPLTVSA
jgi:CBS domain-containing protein